MAVRFLVIISLASAAVYAQPIDVAQNQNGNQNFVPGVFISTDALKNLQDKAQQNQNAAITNQGSQPITNARNSGLSASSQNDDPKIGSAYPTNTQNVPVDTRSQPTILANQPTAPNQIVLPQNQPQIVAQVLPSQPSSQAIMVTQPGNQAILVSQPGYSQSQPVYVNQPTVPGTQFVSQPNQQVVLPNGQVAQIVSTSNGQPLINNGQPFINSAGQLVNNGQPIYISTNPGVQNNGQPMLVTNPGNQVTLIQGSSPNNVQNPSGVRYAVVPVNNNNMAAVPNTNLGNGNTYVMVPNTNQVYAVSNG